MRQVEAGHADNLRNQHMRYMWIPHTDAVVVVASNPLPAGAPPPALPPPAFSEEERACCVLCCVPTTAPACFTCPPPRPPAHPPAHPHLSICPSVHLSTCPCIDQERTRPLRELLLAKSGAVPAAEAAAMSFAQLRDSLLALAPLDKAHVTSVNRAEAEFWRRSQVLEGQGAG